MVLKAPRPWFLTVIALFQGIISGLSVVSGVLLILLMTGQVHLFSHDLTQFSAALKALIVLGLAISLEGAIATVGLWQLRSWGWFGSLGFHALCMVNTGLTLAAGQPLNTSVYLSTLTSAALLACLTLPTTRQHFQPPVPIPDIDP
jgi:hypothetical protein